MRIFLSTLLFISISFIFQSCEKNDPIDHVKFHMGQGDKNVAITEPPTENTACVNLDGGVGTLTFGVFFEDLINQPEYDEGSLIITIYDGNQSSEGIAFEDETLKLRNTNGILESEISLNLDDHYNCNEPGGNIIIFHITYISNLINKGLPTGRPTDHSNYLIVEICCN